MVAPKNAAYSGGDRSVTGDSQNTTSADCSGTIAVGHNKTCTVTNNDQAAHLIVIKHVINDNGGTAVASNFTMSVTGSSPSPASFAGVESPGTTVTLNAGSYSVGETGLPGYTGSSSAYCTGSIAVGQTKTCTITNDDQPAHLTLVKNLINSHGGTATLLNFPLTAAGPTSMSGVSGTAAVTNVAVNAGTYTLSEPGAYGYIPVGLVCLGRAQSLNQVALSVGHSLTCHV